MNASQVTDREVDTGPASVHVRQAGDGTPALVFLHYYGGSGRTWRLVIDRLADRARCVAVDHRGWGRSSAPASGYAIADLAADAQAVTDALGLDDYILVGHSMGGKVAQLVASRRPPGLRGVVLVAPAPAAPAEIPDEARRQMSEAYLSREAVLGALDHVLSHVTLSDAMRRQVVEDSLAGAPEAKRAWPSAAILEDVSADLGAIDVPVLVVAARQDGVEPVELMRDRVVPSLPEARLEVIEDCGHLIPLERPNELADRIRAFWDAVGVGDRRTPRRDRPQPDVG